MSCVGVASGAPWAGERMLFEESMRIRASACASALSGRWTAIWSPSKSALNAWQTSGWTWIALPSTSTGSNAWMPRRWSVGARLRSTGGSWITRSRTPQPSGIIEYHLLGRLDVLRGLALDELGHDERLEQLERHELRQAALVQAQRRAGHDDRAARVVDALAQQVLAEAALLALQHVAEGLERPVARAGNGAPAAAVVEQGVDGLLEHPLLVVDDDLGRAEVEQPLEAVVAVDDAPVEVVEVRRGETATVELHHRAQLRRDDRDGLEHHHLRAVAGVDEGADDLQALDRAGLLLALGRLDRLLELLALVVEVDLLEQLAHRLGAHAALEVLPEAVRRAEALLELTEQRLVIDDVLGLHGLEELPNL